MPMKKPTSDELTYQLAKGAIAAKNKYLKRLQEEEETRARSNKMSNKQNDEFLESLHEQKLELQGLVERVDRAINAVQSLPVVRKKEELAELEKHFKNKVTGKRVRRNRKRHRRNADAKAGWLKAGIGKRRNDKAQL
jgi:SMC interacting uncharacterized protein involved in chromosome segregation